MFSAMLILPYLLLAFSQVDAAQNEPEQSLLWGTFRPNLYFGLRPRVPESLMTGLIWFNTMDFQAFPKARHTCHQDDNLDSYTFTHHDPREGAIEVIKDSRDNVKLTIEWLKVPGGDHGGSWAARVKGEPLDPEKPLRISLLWYLGLEGLGGIELENDEDENGIEGPVKFTGTSPELGDFRLRILDGPDNTYITTGIHASDFAQTFDRTHYVGLKAPPGRLWQARDMLLQRTLENAQAIFQNYNDPEIGMPDLSFVLKLPDETLMSSNLYAIQKMFDGPFQFDIFFESASGHHKLDSHSLTQGVTAFKASYEQRFEDAFPIRPPYNSSHVGFSRDITANLFGGVGYFYGDSIIDDATIHDWDKEEDVEPSNLGPRPVEARELLTATPSRSFFPRGFYWDEGFHLLHIGEFDNDLSLEILRDWFNLIDEDGWVGREQILGDEARSKVPPEFVAQYPTYANPPTLTMAVTALIKRLRIASRGLSDADLGLGGGVQMPLGTDNNDNDGPRSAATRHLDSPELAQEFLKAFYPKIRRHYDWFRRTQRGGIKLYGRKARSSREGYRWRGRSETHVLTSGLDDYPRGPPHAAELHLDLLCWMGFFSRTMKDIANFMGNTEDETLYAEHEAAIIANIDDLHWSEKDQMYCDVGLDDETDESIHHCHRGYVSLFPLLLGLLPPSSPHLGAILDLMHSPDHLWSNSGLRSLSAQHEKFMKDENYWRGNIWIQMNYLALKSLHELYAAQPGPFQKQAATIYDELRRNVVDNTFKEYQRTGYVWEQYDALTGEGQRSHPFTGWTSLVTLILSEKY